MFTLTTYFEEMLRNTAPPQERMDAASSVPHPVRDYLKSHTEFETVAPHSQLVGSYAQHMCVGDVKDVDFLVRVPGDPDKNEPEAKQLIRDLKTALDGLPEALEYEGYTDIDITGARRSVHVYIREPEFHLDVVPCIAPDGFDNKLYVPDKGFNEWIPSHPCGYVSLISDLNDEHGGKVRKLGKLLKHFRNYQMTYMRPKSYWLGALLVHHIQNTLDTSKSLAELFRDLVDAIYTQYDHLLWTSASATPDIKDPMLGHPISWNWGRHDFEAFMKRLDKARNWAEDALEADDKEKAVELWQKVFGTDFPSELTEETTSQAAAFAWPGIAGVSKSGLITHGSGMASRETKFHGTEE